MYVVGSLVNGRFANFNQNSMWTVLYYVTCEYVILLFLFIQQLITYKTNCYSLKLFLIKLTHNQFTFFCMKQTFCKLLNIF